MSAGSTSVMAPRAIPTASAQTWSSRAARAAVLVVTPPLSLTRVRAAQRLPQISAPGGDGSRLDETGWGDAAASYRRTCRWHRRQGAPGARARFPARQRLGDPPGRRRPGPRRGQRDRHGPALRPACALLRRRHAPRDRPGRHDLLRRAARRGAEQSRALPVDHHGAVRPARTRGRAAARPLPPRPAVRARGDNAWPGLPRVRDRGQPAGLGPLPGGVRRPCALPGVRRCPLGGGAPAAARGRRTVPGRRPRQRLRHVRGRSRRADRAGRVLVRFAVAVAGRVVDLPGRHGDLATAAAPGRLRPAGGGAPAVSARCCACAAATTARSPAGW